MLGYQYCVQVHGWIPRTPFYERFGRQMLWHLTSTARCEHTMTPPQRHSAVDSHVWYIAFSVQLRS